MTRIVLILLLVIFHAIQLNAQKDKHIDKKKSHKEDSPQAESAQILSGPNVSIYFTHYYPNCGGAAPDESQMNNFQPLCNTPFLLMNLITNTDTLVKTDSTGRLNLNLAPGKYGIKELYKDIPFDEFYQKYNIGADMYTQNMGKECYQDWWSRLMLEFVITDETTTIQLEASTSDACFTGNNPCLIYTGPYPP